MDYYSVNRVSNSYLSSVKKKLQGIEDKRNKEALNFGTGFHCLVLEPEKFDSRDYRGKDMMTMIKMAQSVRGYVDNIYLEGEKEKEYYYDYLGLPCKLKADIVNTQTKRVVDLKTTMATNTADFMKQAIEYDYIRQSAWYLDCPLIDAEEFVIIGVSKVKPYPVFFWQMTKNDQFIEAGREEYMFLIDYVKNSEEIMKQFEMVKSVESKILN